MAQGSFHGVISELTVDKTRLGLWNFDSTYGCKATYPGSHNTFFSQKLKIKHFNPIFEELELKGFTFSIFSWLT